MSTQHLIAHTFPYSFAQTTGPNWVNSTSTNLIIQSEPGKESSLVAPSAGAATAVHKPMLSHYLRIGRTYHGLCRHAFVEKSIIGYYQYERRVEFRTCAIAAAYAGAFGPTSIERPEFSYSMAIWRLSQQVGYDLEDLSVYGPTGRYQSVACELIELVDKDYWTREGVVEWLHSLKL